MRVFIILVFLGGAFNVKSQNATVKGVITYYFNEYQGDKPDLGSKVYLINAKEASFLDKEVIDSFEIGKFYYYSYIDNKQLALLEELTVKEYEGKKRFKAEYEVAKKSYERRIEARERYFKRLKEFNIETEQKFDSLDIRVFRMLLQINNSNALIATIDATGAYSILGKPGDYYVYIKSNNRKDASMTEVLGKIYFKKITLKENDVIDISYNFEVR